MKALVITHFGGPDVLHVEDRPMPQPHGDQIVARVAAAGLNRADLLQREGRYPPPPGVPADIPGLEFCGFVSAIGPDARGFATGDRVFGLVGGASQAEYVLTRTALAIHVPAALSDVEAGGVPEAYITAHDALVTLGSLKRGERVLVHAIGSGVGMAAAQIAQQCGCTVFGTTRSAEKASLVGELGLARTFDSSAEDFAQSVAAATGGAGVDVIIDFVGAPYFERNIACLSTCGRLVVVSTLGGVDAALSLRTLMTKRLHVIGTVLRSRSDDEKAAATAAFVRDVVPLLASRAIAPLIARTYRLDEAAAAHRYMGENQNVGKVVFEL
ncbi:MAG TPA: NAD(P)H-quinone oxidoreductase [Candidatus Eremiobacteraceae bacterium]|nr:NAD(P)H-quinone oxidoreductase [Candidatus Eremiobacteraceae bacterium]